MKVDETIQIINHLTSDPDERQDLWVQYLENGDVSELVHYLAKVRKNHSEEQLLQITLWRQANNASELSLLELFDHFSDLEQSVMRLLALGATLPQICGIKRIGVVRLRHIISVIREHSCWKDLEDGT